MFSTRFAAILPSMYPSRFFSAAAPAIHNNFIYSAERLKRIPKEYWPRAINFDIAGTLADPRCIAPYNAFKTGFKQLFDILLTPSHIVGPMGMNKRDHIKLIINDLRETGHKNKGANFTEKDSDEGRDFTEKDIDDVYALTATILEETLKSGQHTELTPHADQALQFFQRHGVQTGLTTGYPFALAEYAASQITKIHKFNAFTAADKVSPRTRQAMIKATLTEMNLLHEISRTIFFTDSISDTLSVKGEKLFPFVFCVLDTSTHLGNPHDMQGGILTTKESLKKEFINAGADAVIDGMHQASLAYLAVCFALQKGYDSKTLPKGALSALMPSPEKPESYAYLEHKPK